MKQFVKFTLPYLPPLLLKIEVIKNNKKFTKTVATLATRHDPRTPAKNHHEAIMQHRNSFESHISLIGGRIRAPRCQALSKRSKVQCKKASLNSKRVCMFHGGKSTGPVTEDGRKRCAIAKTVHGYETRAAREYRAKKFRELKALFDSMYLR